MTSFWTKSTFDSCLRDNVHSHLCHAKRPMAISFSTPIPLPSYSKVGKFPNILKASFRSREYRPSTMSVCDWHWFPSYSVGLVNCSLITEESTGTSKTKLTWNICVMKLLKGLIVFCARCASCALDVSMRNIRKICARFSPNAQYMRTICTRFCFSPMRNICARFAHDCTYFPMRNICPRFAQDCTSFPNAQYMRKICARLYFFLQCAMYALDLCKIVLLSSMRNICAKFAQDYTCVPSAQYLCKICTRLYLFPQCAIYAQDLCKIVLISPMCNICTRFVQDCTYFPSAQYICKISADCTYFPSAQYMRKICARLYLFPQCAIYVQDLCKIVLLFPMCNIYTRLQALLEEICHISHICSKFRMVFTSWLFLDCHKL